MRLDIHKYRPGIETRDHTRCSKKRERRGDHRITRAHIKRHQGQQQGIGAGRHTEGMGDSAIGGNRLFQLALPWGEQDERVSVNDIHYCGLQLTTQGVQLRFKIQQWYFLMDGTLLIY